MKYKEGERVEIIKNTSNHRFNIGEIVNIRSITIAGYTVSNEKDYWYVDDIEIKRTSDKDMKKSELKTGMQIEFESGEQFEVTKVWTNDIVDLKSLKPKYLPNYYPEYFSIGIKNYKILNSK